MCIDVVSFFLIVLNLVFGKVVFGSLIMLGCKVIEGWENVVDGCIRVWDFNFIFYIGFEFYFWLFIVLGGVGLVKNIIFYNWIDNYGNFFLFF